jgi:nucleoside 2-deoxyribosyltransferase
MLIYFAGPLFNEGERAFNAQLAAKLEERGFSVYLPQRDGLEKPSVLFREKTLHEQQKAIFTKDRNHILEADIFLIILDGRVPDEGACVELGIASSQKYMGEKPELLVGYMTDWRAFFPEVKLNAMVDGALDVVVDNEDDLFAELAAWSPSMSAV